MSKRILIVDDEKDMHVYLRTLFRRAGYETDVASSAEEGLSKALAAVPDLITLDLLMPRGSGVKAYQLFRSRPETQTVPIVVLTGLARHEELFRQIEALPPPEAIVEKPIERESFLGLVGGLLREPSPTHG
jgi:two-component system, OmpR family, phosphate regulon response regulator PhoB